MERRRGTQLFLKSKNHNNVSLQIPFPAVIYCPELNKTLIKQHVECLLREQCDGLNSSQISKNFNAIKAGCKVCRHMGSELFEVEHYYNWRLVTADLRKNTYIGYLKNFVDASLIERQSFCMSDRKNLQIRESLGLWSGFCYTIGQDHIFHEKT